MRSLPRLRLCPRTALIAVVVLVGLSGCTIGRADGALIREIHPPLGAHELDRLVAPEALREDLALLVRTLDEVHPGAYGRLSRSAFVGAVDSFAAALTTPRTRRAFYLDLQPIVARLRDGHTAVYYPSGERGRLSARGPVLFPVVVAIENGQLIARQQTGGIAAGDTIASIDGTAGTEWAARATRLMSGESVAMQEAFGGREFAELHALYDPDGGPFDVRVGGAAFRLDGITRDSLRALRRSLVPSRLWSYATRADGVGVLTVRGFRGGLQPFYDFLDGAVAQFRQDSATALVVDVRDNSGGDSRMMADLVSRLADTPYRIASRTEHRRSHQYGRFWKHKFVGSPTLRLLLRVLPLHRLHPVSRRYYTAPVGTNVLTELPLEAPAEAERFAAPFAVLTSRYSASAAVVLAAVVQDHGLGMVIGEETGEWATMHGEAYYFELPNARLLTGVSTYRLVRPSGSEAPGGVLPDIPVPAEDALEEAARYLLTLTADTL